MCMFCGCSLFFMWNAGSEFVKNVANEWLNEDPNIYIKNIDDLPDWKKEDLKRKKENV